jgi:putative transcriptional regulator
MAQVLRIKNFATRFQIMVEIAANQPFIQQKEIAQHIGITSQAVSEYVSELEKDGWISTDGRSRYHITREGANWVLKSLRDLQQYTAFADKALTNIMTWAAVADIDLTAGQEVGLIMKEGLLVATRYQGKGARGIAATKAKQGDDVGITNIEGIVNLQIGKVTVIEVPDIKDGGSSRANLPMIQRELSKVDLTASLGIEALISLRKLQIAPNYIYGVTAAAVEAVRSGLTLVVVCSANESPSLLQKLTVANVDYKLVNAKIR